MSDTSNIIVELKQLETYESIIRRLEVAACALFLWDFALTFHHEVTILWGTRWSRTKILFFINRYFPLGAIIVSLYCQLSVMCIVLALTVSQSMFKQIQLYPRHVFTNYDFIGPAAIANIEIILLRRLFILYQHKRVVVVSMVVLYIGVFATMIGMAIAMSVYSQTREYVISGMCLGDFSLSWFTPFWVPLMVFDFIIVVLAGIKSVQNYRTIPNKNWFSARFMKVLARDSFMYFAVNFLNYLVITLVIQLAPAQFMTLGASWTMMIPPITANHLLINMEYSQLANAGTGSTTNANTYESTVEFGEIGASDLE